MYQAGFFAAVLLLAAAPAQAISRGDLAFTSFNADAEGWAVVALAELAPHTTVYFSDNAWDSAAGLFVGSESHHRWNSGPQPVTAGTVITFSRTDHATLLAASTGSLSRARVAGSSTYDLSQTAETLYAYVGNSATAPQLFITALSTGGFSPAVGGLAGTGLVVGLHAVELGRGSDFAEYAGPRQGYNAAQFQPLTASAAQWADLGDGLFKTQAIGLSAFEVTAVPEAGAPGLALVGLGILGAWRWRRRGGMKRVVQPALQPPCLQLPARCRSWQRLCAVNIRLCLRSQRNLVVAAVMTLAAPWAPAAELVTKVLDLGALAAPVTLSFGDSFNDLDAFATGIQIAPSGVALTLQAGDFFINRYRMDVGAVDVTAIAGTIDLATILNVNALELHLYGGSMALPVSSVGAGSALAGLLPLFSSTGGSELQTLQGVVLASGTYVLEVRGQVVGSAGGSYAGVLNLSPVPNASGWALSLAGLGVLLWSRRRQTRRSPNGPRMAA